MHIWRFIINKKILLCITSSIAAYKSAGIASKLTHKGYDVYVVMTHNAAKFISPIVFETLTKNKVYVDLFKDGDHTHVTHISYATECDLILVAPATYNIIGKSACGIADDLLSSILAAAACNRPITDPPPLSAQAGPCRHRTGGAGETSIQEAQS